MSVKINEVLRAIRDKHYEETKAMTVEEQIAYYREKSELLRKEIGNRLGKKGTDLGE